MDPAALGTAIIGIEWAKAENQDTSRTHRGRRRTVAAGTRFRQLLAAMLHRTAERIDRTPATAR